MQVTRSRVLVALAVVAMLVAFAIQLTWLHWPHELAWVEGALTLFFLSFLA